MCSSRRAEIARPGALLAASLAASLIAMTGCNERGSGGGAARDAAPATSSMVAAAATETAAAEVVTPAATAEPAAPAKPRRDRATLIAAGDACFGRLLGQELLKNPAFDPFASTARLLGSADIRFVNLESQLSDQKGETQSPTQKLVFTGPPGGADALARGHVDIVSTANNHMWDYGQAAFFETLDHLDRAGVKYAGAGRTRERAYAPEIVDVGGFRVAFLAFTGIWNQGALKHHAARDHVAEASASAVVDGVKKARARGDADIVVVSYHGGEEYVSVPLQGAVDLHHAAVDAGADAVLGHHPHVAQGIEIYKSKPIFYSLGNYLMRTHGTHLETEIGFLARLAFSKTAPPEAWVCPFRVSGIVPTPIPLAEDPRRAIYERVVRQRLRVVQGSIVNPARVGPTGEDGCSAVTAQ